MAQRAFEASCRFASSSEPETERLAESLAPLLETGDLVTLSGPLGAGKTRFVMGLARGLAARGRVRSPTFTLVHEYRGRIVLMHVDLYRVEPGEIVGLGLEEGLERAAMVVEWGERLPQSLRAEALAVEVHVISATRRSFDVRATHERAGALLHAWRSAAAGTTSSSSDPNREGA